MCVLKSFSRFEVRSDIEQAGFFKAQAFEDDGVKKNI